MTEQVRAFQRSAFDHLGQALVVDGNLGPKTNWAMSLASLAPERIAIVLRAIGKLGLEEANGTNRHPEIDQWLGRCGTPLGLAWCAAFASWSVSASVHAAIAGAQNLGRHFVATPDPYPGDVMWYPTGAATGHCGIVTGVTLAEVMCIEGNQRNAVRCTRRSRSSCRFSRVPLPLTGDAPGIPPGVQFHTNGLEGTR